MICQRKAAGVSQESFGQELVGAVLISILLLHAQCSFIAPYFGA